MNDIEINNLIQQKKAVQEKPTRDFKDSGQDMRNGFTALSEDKNNTFSVFIRKNKNLIDAFSIGLIYHPKNEPQIVLLRFNGNHSDHRNEDGTIVNGFHIHKATQNAIENGYKPENFAENTDKYSSFESALSYFLEYINLSEAKQYFGPLKGLDELSLF
jgi:hypothetical protein